MICELEGEMAKGIFSLLLCRRPKNYSVKKFVLKRLYAGWDKTQVSNKSYKILYHILLIQEEASTNYLYYENNIWMMTINLSLDKCEYTYMYGHI